MQRQPMLKFLHLTAAPFIALLELPVLAVPSAQATPAECYKQALPRVYNSQQADRAAQL